MLQIGSTLNTQNVMNWTWVKLPYMYWIRVRFPMAGGREPVK